MVKANKVELAELSPLIVRMATQQDRDAFAEMFLHLRPKVMQFLIERANGALNRAELEEACQEAFATTWRESGKFDPRADEPLGWLFSVARNHAIQALHKTMEQADIIDHLRLTSPPPQGMDDGLYAGQRLRLLHSALGRLPRAEIALLREVYLEGLSHLAIARRHRLPAGTLKAAIRRAIRRLRDAMTGPGT